jgi:CDP-diacylglycerol--serine O-phosphatidyltransferase
MGRGRGRRRRRRARGTRRRGVYLLPHLFTSANLFFGFWAVVHAFLGNADRAAFGIVLAAACDALDGRIARLTHTTSRFGVEYDSIADTVAFGVAPAILAFTAGNLQELGRPGFVMAFLYTVCAALRLARFNVQSSRYAGRFEGLPSPAAALMVATTQWFFSYLREPPQWFETLLSRQWLGYQVPPALVGAGAVALGLLMVSTIPYRSFKELDLRQSHLTLVWVVIALVVLLAVKPEVTLFAIALAYVIAGPVEWAWRSLAGRPLERLVPVAGPLKDEAHEH